MRYANRSQCPACHKKWAVRSVGVLGNHDIYICRFCDWMPADSRQRLTTAKRVAIATANKA